MRLGSIIGAGLAALLAAGCEQAVEQTSDSQAAPAEEAVAEEAPAALRVDPPEAAIRARYGQEFDEAELSHWTDLGGGLIFWGERHAGPDIGVAVLGAPGRMMLLSSSLIGHNPDGSARWRLADGVTFEADDQEDYIAYSCKLSLEGAFTPGLIAVIRGEPIAHEDSESALLGPARVAFHVDQNSGRLTREEAPVYCDHEAYGI